MNVHVTVQVGSVAHGSRHAGRSYTDSWEEELFGGEIDNDEEKESCARGLFRVGEEYEDSDESEEEGDEEEEEEKRRTKEERLMFQPMLTDRLFKLHGSAAEQIARRILTKCAISDVGKAISSTKAREEMVERWGKPAGRQQRYQVEQDREQNLEDSAREQEDASIMKECAAAMAKEAAKALLKALQREEQVAKEKAASAERAAAFDELCARKRTQRMKEFLPKLAVQLGRQYGRAGGDSPTPE